MLKLLQLRLQLKLIKQLSKKSKLLGIDYKMTETAEKLKLELSQLSLQERAELAQFLLHSLNEGTDDDVEAAWDTELFKRLEDIHRGTAIGEPSQQVFSELREKFS